MEVVIVKGEGAVLGVNLGRPIVTNVAYATRSSQITLRTCSATDVNWLTPHITRSRRVLLYVSSNGPRLAWRASDAAQK